MATPNRIFFDSNPPASGGQNDARSQRRKPRRDQGQLSTRPAIQTAEQPNEINDLFRGLRQQATPQGFRRPIVRRAMSGQEMNPDGSDPGSGMAWFDRNNSEAQVNERQARVGRDDARRYAQINQAGSAAVAERKALQEMGGAPYQQGKSNLVKGNDGYMDLFGPGGRILGSNRPQGKVPGFADPTNTNLENQRASQGMQNEFQQNFLTGQRPAPKPQNSQSDVQMMAQQAFPTPGGSGGSTVGGPPERGAPGGGTFQMNLPTRPTDSWDEDLPQAGKQFQDFMSRQPKVAMPTSAPIPAIQRQAESDWLAGMIAQPATASGQPAMDYPWPANAGPQLPAPQFPGVIPSLWQSGDQVLFGLNDLYRNYIGNPLDKLLFGLDNPPANQMQQYQKQINRKPGLF